jgi:hypothetical protein
MSQRHSPYWPRVKEPVATNEPTVPDFMRTLSIDLLGTEIVLICVSPV